jgi:hypothetical protein
LRFIVHLQEHGICSRQQQAFVPFSSAFQQINLFPEIMTETEDMMLQFFEKVFGTFSDQTEVFMPSIGEQAEMFLFLSGMLIKG